MKKNYIFSLLAVLFLAETNAQVHEIIWSEDFNSYANLYGIEGSASGTVNIGGYDPSTFTKWQLEANGANLANFSDYVAVFSSSGYTDKHLRAQDTDTGVDWITENIDVSNYESVSVSMYIAEVGDHEDSEASGGDWFDVYYSFDNGANYTLLPNWNNLGNATHTLTGDTVHGTGCATDDDFESTQIFFNIPDAENNLKIKITMKNGSTTENFILDDVYVTGIDNTLSVDENALDTDVLVYPNPTKGAVNISLPNSMIKSIQLYDINQRLLKEYTSIASNTFNMDVQNLSKGMYFMHIEDTNNIKKNHKLIIE